MRRKTIAVFSLCLVLIIAVLAVGPSCTESEPAETPAAAPATTTAPAQTTAPATETTPATTTPTQEPAEEEPAEEVIELSFATIMPAEAPIGQTFQEWADLIGEKTGGKVHITTYMAGALLKHGEMYRGIQDGIADVAWYSPTEDPGNWDLNSFQDLAFLGFKSAQQATNIYNDILNDDSYELRKEFTDKGFIPYGCLFTPPFQLFTGETAVRVPADIEGMKCYAVGEMANVIQAAGGAPVTMEISETYMSWDRGLIDGACTHFAAMLVYGILEFPQHVTIYGDGGCYTFMDCFIINADTYNSLPDDVKKVFEDYNGWMTVEGTNSSFAEVDIAMGVCQEQGIELLELTDEEIDQWEALATPYHDEWLTKMEEKGKGEQAHKLWDAMKQGIETYPLDLQ